MFSGSEPADVADEIGRDVLDEVGRNVPSVSASDFGATPAASKKGLGPGINTSSGKLGVPVIVSSVISSWSGDLQQHVHISW